MSQEFEPQDSQNFNKQSQGPQDEYQNSQTNSDIHSPMLWSILSLLCFFPFGIVSVIYSAKVKSLLSAGSFLAAKQAVAKAKMWAWISFGMGVFLWGALFYQASQVERVPVRDIVNSNNIKQVSLAIRSYDIHYGILPPAYSENKNGERLHSWRVMILPYLAEEDLYSQIRLNEPWDSEWNKQFHDKCPISFKSPGFNLEPSETTYAIVVGNNTAFPGSRSRRVSDLIDGENKTGMIVERSPVCWMDPSSDVPFEEAIKGVNASPNGIRANWMQSSPKMQFVFMVSTFNIGDNVYTLPERVSKDFIRKLFTIYDGEDIDLNNPELNNN